MIINVKKLRADAVLPLNAEEESIGFDVTILEKGKQLGPNTHLYHTGIAIQPPPGYYTELVPRSSISKTGYFMANSFGVIDNSYTGELLIALTKIDENAPDILAEGPIRIAQLITRKEIKYKYKLVDELKQTKRADGAFGSTGK